MRMIRLCTLTSAAALALSAAVPAETVDADKALTGIVIPEVSFQEATTADVLNFIIKTVRETEAQRGTGTRAPTFVVSITPAQAALPVTMNLRQVSAKVLLQTVLSMGRIPYRMDGASVIIGPIAEADGRKMITRIYRFPVHQVTELRKKGAKAYLEGFGMSFPEGSEAVYSGKGATLTVVNTADSIARLDASLKAIGAVPLK